MNSFFAMSKGGIMFIKQRRREHTALLRTRHVATSIYLSNSPSKLRNPVSLNSG